MTYDPNDPRRPSRPRVGWHERRCDGGHRFRTIVVSGRDVLGVHRRSADRLHRRAACDHRSGYTGTETGPLRQFLNASAGSRRQRLSSSLQGTTGDRGALLPLPIREEGPSDFLHGSFRDRARTALGPSPSISVGSASPGATNALLSCDCGTSANTSVGSSFIEGQSRSTHAAGSSVLVGVGCDRAFVVFRRRLAGCFLEAVWAGAVKRAPAWP